MELTDINTMCAGPNGPAVDFSENAETDLATEVPLTNIRIMWAPNTYLLSSSSVYRILKASIYHGGSQEHLKCRFERNGSTSTPGELYRIVVVVGDDRTDFMGAA